MKAKKVYEFKRTRKQGLSDKTKLSLEILEKKKIDDWFKQYAPDVVYHYGPDLIANTNTVIVDNQGKIIHLKSLDELNWLPPFSIIRGGLYIENCFNLKELPETLREIDYLFLINTGTIKIPEFLNINQTLTLRDNEYEEFPIKSAVFTLKDFFISNSKIKNLPKYITADEFISLDNLPNLEIGPTRLISGFKINLKNLPKYTTLPNTLITKYLTIKNTGPIKLPEDFDELRINNWKINSIEELKNLLYGDYITIE